MVVVLAQQQRNAGTYRSTPQAGSSVPDGVIQATGILGAADLQDATLLVTMGIEANDTPNAGANAPGWYVLAASDWHAGLGRDGVTWPPPTANAPTDNLPATVRGFLTINKRTNIGVDIVVA